MCNSRTRHKDASTGEFICLGHGGRIDHRTGLEYQRRWERMTWLYGETRALTISLGQDPDTQIDLEKWRNLGR